DKACGEGLMPGALPLLRRIGVDPPGHPLRGVTYSDGTGDSPRVTHRFTTGEGRGVRRTTLHRALADRAKELGVATISGRAVAVRINTSLDGTTTAAVQVESVSRDPSTPGELHGEWITAHYLLACDGLHSTIARLAGLRATAAPARSATHRPHHTPRRFGVRQHYAVAPWSDNIEVYYGPSAEFYITPVSDGEVGVAMLAAQGTDFDKALQALPELARRLEGAAPASSRRGAGPFGQTTLARQRGPVLLVGDASGYVDAITGEGLRLGIAQAAIAVRCIATNQPERYNRAWAKETRQFRLLTSGLVIFATSPARRLIVPLAVRLPRLFGLVVERLAR
ncbi:MAG: FAD-binding protein, partial [Glaciihabitans sp.]|nr:FAD-binding protein [Glaciihabitans sp.]